MNQRTVFALRSGIASIALAISATALAPVSHAAPAESCLSAPKGVAPQGSHWYYRIDRPSQRKCWYLAEKGRKVAQRAAPRSAPPAEPAEEADAAPAPAAAAPVAAPPVAAAAPVTDQPKPVITTLVTRNVSNPGEIAQATPGFDSAQVAPLQNSAREPAAEAAPAPVEQAPPVPQAPVATAAPAVQPAVVAPDDTALPSADTMPTLKLLLGAIAFLGFAASALFFIMAMVRRRKDVLNVQRETDMLPFEDSPEIAAEQHEPTFRPAPALDPIRQHDDVDEILHRLARRRRAA